MKKNETSKFETEKNKEKSNKIQEEKEK